MSTLHKLKERTHVTHDGKLAKPDHKGPARLLGIAGDEIPLSQAIELGLVKPEKKEEVSAADKAAAKEKADADKKAAKEKADADKKTAKEKADADKKAAGKVEAK